MKNNVKLMLMFILGIVISSTISVCAVNVLSSRDVTYTSNNENFKASNVGDALDTLYDSVDITKILPVGSVISYMGPTAPDHYLLCDGTVYNIADYKKLADHIKDGFGSYNYFGGNGTTTFAVPDLRGEFLRGAGTNSHANQGSGAAVGTHQDGTKHRGFRNNTSMMLFPTDKSEIGYQGNVDFVSSAPSNTIRAKTDSWAGSSESNSFLWYTSRPTNTSVNFIIKAK